MIRFVFAGIAAIWATTAHADVEIQEITSPGGIDAWLVESHDIPFTALEIRVKGGTSLDLPGKRGATNLMVALLEEGAGDLNAQQFQTELERLAASYSFRVYGDTFSVSAQFLTENQDQAVDLLRQALVEPRFDQDAIDRVRTQVIAGIESDAKDPSAIAGATFDRLAFGDHPYGTSGDGTVEGVTALTRDDLVEAHQRIVTRDRIYVSAVGDITADELGVLLDDLLGDLPAESPDLPDRINYDLAGGVTVVEYATPQSVVLFGHSGIPRDHPDFMIAYVLNEILGGGGMGSRLFDEVREKRGLTYGVYSYLIPRELSETYFGRLASANDRVAEAVEVIQSEWARMAQDGVTAEELAEAKTYLTGAYPLRFDGNGPIADIMVGMQMQGLPVDYIAGRNDLVNAITLDEINRVASEILHPGNLHFVIVGEPVGINADTVIQADINQ